MENRLSQEELAGLIRSVFPHQPGDRRIGILFDLPDEKVPDNPEWKKRREMALNWAGLLQPVLKETGLQSLTAAVYTNVHNNNADLPERFHTTDRIPEAVDGSWIVRNGKRVSADTLFSETQVWLAPTEFSATAPLKVLARRFGFRAATMPGFSERMIPALRLDYEEINRRVFRIRNLLDPAESLIIVFQTGDEELECRFDLRFRQAHASGGRFPEAGTAGNLPSGECYIVPYEGEKGIPSLSEGRLPVQFGEEVVVYRIENNRAVEVLTDGPASRRERDRIKKEPAYANIAEIGFGILNDFGLKPAGEILLDEKLGLHIAFGRSDHFGGAVGPQDFTSPEAVCHLDRIYLPELQNRVQIKSVELIEPADKACKIMASGRYCIF